MLFPLLITLSSLHATPLLDELFPCIEERPVLEARYCTEEACKIVVEKASTLEAKLKKKVIGQDHAVEEVASAIMRYAVGVNDPNTVIASFLFSGPSGVGKTELAKQLCSELYGHSGHFVRLNMSEFSEAHTISRLIGSPPGYVGYSEGGQLTNALLANPYSVVLLDEVEKAHPQVQKLFLHVFDEGLLTSALGQEIDCRYSIFICTSNILASEIANLHEAGHTLDEISAFLQPYFIAKLSPELFNRLNFIVFSPLTKGVMEQLVERLLNDLHQRVHCAQGISLSFDRSLIRYLVDQGIDPQLGARPLKRFIDKKLTTVVAASILREEIQSGDLVKCSFNGESVVIECIFHMEQVP